jgi:hypothetical protein
VADPPEEELLLDELPLEEDDELEPGFDVDVERPVALSGVNSLPLPQPASNSSAGATLVSLRR